MALLEYIQDFSPLTPRLDGRVVACTNATTAPAACSAPYKPMAPCSGPVDPVPKPLPVSGAKGALAAPTKQRAQPLMWQGKPFVGFHAAENTGPQVKAQQ